MTHPPRRKAAQQTAEPAVVPNPIFDILSQLAADKVAGSLNTRHLQLVAALSREIDHQASVTHIAFVLGLPPGAITRAADRLVENGLIVRIRPADDRRAVLLGLTPAGIIFNNRIGAIFAASGKVAA